MYNVTLRRVHDNCCHGKALNFTYLCVFARVGVCMQVHACSLAHTACNWYAPYCDVICGFSGSTIFFDISS